MSATQMQPSARLSSPQSPFLSFFFLVTTGSTSPGLSPTQSALHISPALIEPSEKFVYAANKSCILSLHRHKSHQFTASASDFHYNQPKISSGLTRQQKSSESNRTAFQVLLSLAPSITITYSPLGLSSSSAKSSLKRPRFTDSKTFVSSLATAARRSPRTTSASSKKAFSR